MKSKLLATALILLATLTGCAPVSYQDSMMDSAPGIAYEGADGSTGTNYVDRSVIRSAWITLETEDLDASRQEVERLVEQNSGYFDGWSESSNDAGESWAYFATIRVPNQQLDGVLEQLQLLGTVTQLELSSVDVTTQILDVDARIRSLTESVARLEQLIASATTTAELIEIENALSARQAELESLQAQAEYLKSQVDFSTIKLSLYLAGRGPVAEPENFLEGISYGFEALLAFFSGALVALGFAVPWLIVVVPLVIAVLVSIRIFRKRSRAS